MTVSRVSLFIYPFYLLKYNYAEFTSRYGGKEPKNNKERQIEIGGENSLNKQNVSPIRLNMNLFVA